MGEPSRGEERPRDRLLESYLISQTVGIADPLALSVHEFDGLLRMAMRGRLVEASHGGDPCRAFVDAAVSGA